MTTRHLEPDTPDDDSPEADDGWFRDARPAPDVLRELLGDADAARMTGQRQWAAPGSEASKDDGTAPTVPTPRLTR